MEKEYIKLESVGCVIIDNETLDTYPMDNKGEPILDEDERFPLDSIDDYWFDRLSDVDFSTVQELLNKRV